MANGILIMIVIGGILFLVVQVLLLALAVMLGNIWATNHFRNMAERQTRKEMPPQSPPMRPFHAQSPAVPPAQSASPSQWQ